MTNITFTNFRVPKYVKPERNCYYNNSMAKSLFFAAQNKIPIPNEYLGCGYKGLGLVEMIVD